MFRNVAVLCTILYGSWDFHSSVWFLIACVQDRQVWDRPESNKRPWLFLTLRLISFWFQWFETLICFCYCVFCVWFRLFCGPVTYWFQIACVLFVILLLTPRMQQNTDSREVRTANAYVIYIYIYIYTNIYMCIDVITLGFFSITFEMCYIFGKSSKPQQAWTSKCQMSTESNWTVKEL